MSQEFAFWHYPHDDTGGAQINGQFPLYDRGHIAEVPDAATRSRWSASSKASLILLFDPAAPEPIGSGTPNTGAFTTLSASGASSIFGPNGPDRVELAVSAAGTSLILGSKNTGEGVGILQYDRATGRTKLLMGNRGSEAEVWRVSGALNVSFGTGSDASKPFVVGNAGDGFWTETNSTGGANSVLGLGGHPGATDGNFTIKYNRATGQTTFGYGPRDNPNLGFFLENNGSLGLKNDNPTEVLDVNGDAIRVRTAQTPASASAASDQGVICWDADYIYVATAANTWKRVALSTW